MSESGVVSASTSESVTRPQFCCTACLDSNPYATSLDNYMEMGRRGRDGGTGGAIRVHGTQRTTGYTGS